MDLGGIISGKALVAHEHLCGLWGRSPATRRGCFRPATGRRPCSPLTPLRQEFGPNRLCTPSSPHILQYFVGGAGVVVLGYPAEPPFASLR